MKFKLFVFLLFFTGWINAHAQTYKWRAELERVPENGFYKIALTPQLISITENPGLSDIRIFEQQKEIPYLISKTPDSVYQKDTTVLRLQNYTVLPTPSIKVTEDKVGKRTIAEIKFKADYQVDKLILDVKGFKYYRRTAWFTEKNPVIAGKKKYNNEHRLETFIISSEKPPVIDLYGENRYKQLFLVIDNEDNEPLSIQYVIGYQKNIELITYLEKHKRYVMKTGQSDLPSPRYDLNYFKDSISNTVPFVKIAHLRIDEQTTTTHESIWFKKSVMWAALCILILFLGYLSYFMVKDMQRKKQNR